MNALAANRPKGSRRLLWLAESQVLDVVANQKMPPAILGRTGNLTKVALPLHKNVARTLFIVDEEHSQAGSPRFLKRYSPYCPSSQGNDALTTLECRSWLLAPRPPGGEQLSPAPLIAVKIPCYKFTC